MPKSPVKTKSAKKKAVSQQRLVRLEVDLIETRRFTKIIELPEDFANRVVGKLWANDNRGGLSEADCVTACMETRGKITDLTVDVECDTIDVLEVPEPNK